MRLTDHQSQGAKESWHPAHFGLGTGIGTTIIPEDRRRKVSPDSEKAHVRSTGTDTLQPKKIPRP